MFSLRKSPRASTQSNQSRHDPANFAGFDELKLLKVHMGTRTLWSDGAFTHDEMASAALHSGYDVVFFADNALQFGAVGELADPSFEDVNASGRLSSWMTMTRGSNNTVAVAAPFGIPSITVGDNFTQSTAYFAKERVKSGNYSVHLAIQSSSTRFGTDGISSIRDIFPGSYIFNQTSPRPRHPLLLNDLTFSANMFIDSLGIAGISTSTRYNARLAALNYSDNGWFYVQFTFVTEATGNFSRSGTNLRATLIYSDHPVDSWLRNITRQMNETNTKYIYMGVPSLKNWLSINVNVTDLASRLWNQTVVDEWRLGNFEIGTRSRHGVMVSAYVDDVSIAASKSGNPLDYFQAAMESRLSNSNFKVYQGYSIDVANQPSLYVYGTDYLPSNRKYNLTNPAFWYNMTGKVTSEGGVAVLGSESLYSLMNFVMANNAFGLKVVDGTTWPGMTIARGVLASGKPVALAASREALTPEDYNSSATWSIMVLAKSNSEADVLDAVASGSAYIAVSNMTGTFEFKPEGLPTPSSRNPVYVPAGENVSLDLAFSGLSGQCPRLQTQQLGSYATSRWKDVCRHERRDERIDVHFPCGSNGRKRLSLNSK